MKEEKPKITIDANETIITMTSVDGDTVDGTLSQYIEAVKLQAVESYRQELLEKLPDMVIAKLVDLDDKIIEVVKLDDIKSLIEKDKEEQCFCQSYYDDNNELKDCTCGKCGKE